MGVMPGAVPLPSVLFRGYSWSKQDWWWYKQWLVIAALFIDNLAFGSFDRIPTQAARKAVKHTRRDPNMTDARMDEHGRIHQFSDTSCPWSALQACWRLAARLSCHFRGPERRVPEETEPRTPFAPGANRGGAR